MKISKNAIILTNQRGFTLTEILVALTLVAIMGTFVAGKIFESLKEGQIKATNIQIKNLASRLQEYRRHCHSYPTTEQGLEALLSKPTTGKECKKYREGGYIDGDSIPEDPWQGEYIYESDGKKILICSMGPDNEEGTEDDICNKERE